MILMTQRLKKKLGDGYTSSQIIQTLRDYNLLKINGEGYLPEYTRTLLTDRLHDEFGFRTDLEFVPTRKMRSIIASTKKQFRRYSSTQHKKPQQPLIHLGLLRFHSFETVKDGIIVPYFGQFFNKNRVESGNIRNYNRQSNLRKTKLRHSLKDDECRSFS